MPVVALTDETHRLRVPVRRTKYGQNVPSLVTKKMSTPLTFSSSILLDGFQCVTIYNFGLYVCGFEQGVLRSPRRLPVFSLSGRERWESTVSETRPT